MCGSIHVGRVWTREFTCGHDSLKFQRTRENCLHIKLYLFRNNSIEIAPEFIVEVAASSASYDLYEKKQVYQRNGVQEYVVWQLYENCIDWFTLQAGCYVVLTPAEDGILLSRVFPGLWLAVNDLLASNLAQVLATVQKGVQTDEHNAFIQKMKA